MQETMMKIEGLKELKEKLVCGAKEALNQGFQNVDTHEMGEVIDMIKDLAEAEEECWKACYYKHITCAMEDGDRARMGYDNWRYSSGRFAPTGRGHYAGYTPMNMDGEMEPYMTEEGYADPWYQTMGYSNGGRNGSSRSSSGMSSGESSGANGRMGYSGSYRGDRYDRYDRARRGYHESKDSKSKEHMDSSAREYVADIAESVKEIWDDADPAMRKEIKNKFVSLTSQMN